MMPHPDWIALDAMRLDLLLHTSMPAHFKTIFAAVQDHGLRLILIRPGKDDTSLQALKQASPFIAIILDDSDTSNGPSAFDSTVLEHLVSLAQNAAVLACAPIAGVYESLCQMAGTLQQNLLLVETLPAHEIEWARYLRQQKSSLPLVVGSVCPNQVRQAGL